RAARPVQPEIDIVLRTTPAPAASTAPIAKPTESGTTACTKVVDQPENHRVGIAVRRGHVMEVLAGSGRPNVRQRDVLQERRRCRIDQGQIDPIRQAVRLILMSTPRTDNLDGLTVIVASPGNIALAF